MSNIFKIGIGHDQETMCCKCYNHHCSVHEALNSSIVATTPLPKSVIKSLLNQQPTIRSSNRQSGDKNVPVAKGEQIGVL
jgi:hypothetical protein